MMWQLAAPLETCAVCRRTSGSCRLQRPSLPGQVAGRLWYDVGGERNRSCGEPQRASIELEIPWSRSPGKSAIHVDKNSTPGQELYLPEVRMVRPGVAWRGLALLLGEDCLSLNKLPQ
jgi:hypothetical protein